MESKRASQARRPDQKHGRDGKGFLGCLIFSQAKTLFFLLCCVCATVGAADRSLSSRGPDAAPGELLVGMEGGSSLGASKIDCIAKLSIPCARLFGSSDVGRGGTGESGAMQRFPVGSRCGWRPLRLIRYKSSQLMFHHPTVQTRALRPLPPPSDTGRDLNPVISKIPTAVETAPSFSACISMAPRGLPSAVAHTLFGGDWGRGRGGTSGYSSARVGLNMPAMHTNTRRSACKLPVFCYPRPLAKGDSQEAGSLHGRITWAGTRAQARCHHPGLGSSRSRPDTHCTDCTMNSRSVRRFSLSSASCCPAEPS